MMRRVKKKERDSSTGGYKHKHQKPVVIDT